MKISKYRIWRIVPMILILSGTYIYSLFEGDALNKNPAYIEGIVEGTWTENKQVTQIYYQFEKNSILYHGSVRYDFFGSCDSCGRFLHRVIVKYEKGNPKNSTLVLALPYGAKLDSN